MNKVDTTNWAARSILSALLLFLLAAPADLMAQERQLLTTDIGQGEPISIQTGFTHTLNDAAALFKTAGTASVTFELVESQAVAVDVFSLPAADQPEGRSFTS